MAQAADETNAKARLRRCRARLALGDITAARADMAVLELAVNDSRACTSLSVIARKITETVRCPLPISLRVPSRAHRTVAAALGDAIRSEICVVIIIAQDTCVFFILETLDHRAPSDAGLDGMTRLS